MVRGPRGQWSVASPPCLARRGRPEDLRPNAPAPSCPRPTRRRGKLVRIDTSGVSQEEVISRIVDTVRGTQR